jgi:signal transduction histidine kinase
MLAMLCWICLLLGAAIAQDEHVVSRAVLVDAEGTLDIADVAAAPDSAFRPVGLIFSGGYTPAVHWMKLVVQAPPDGSPLRLRVRPTYLDEVRLYAPDKAAPDGWRVEVTGDRTPFLERDTPGIALGFVVNPGGPEATYFLRLETTSSSLLHVSAMLPKDAYVAELWVSVLHILSFSLMAGILFWSASELVVSRDAVVGWFALAHALQLIYFLAISGHLAPMLASFGHIDGLTSALVCLVPVSTLIFHRALIKPFAPAPLAWGFLNGLILVCLGVLALLLVGSTQLALQVNAVVVLLSAPMFLMLAVSVRSEGLTGRMALRVVYCLQGLTLVVTMVPLLGLGGGIEWVLHGTLVPGLMSSVLMFILLHRRSRAMVGRALETQFDLGLARQQLAIERRQREAQGHFLSMLSHELKTPITVARIALGTTRAQGEPRRLIEGALDNMNAIIDRCTYADQMDQHELRVVTETCDVPAVIAETVARAPGRERIVADIAPMPPFVTDRVLLGVVVANLLDNGLKYGAESRPVALEAHASEVNGRPGICIIVENEPGRAGRPDKEKLFGKFYRSPGARASSGSGLGLYIVRGIADRLGGTIRYDDKEGRVRFVLWLPC